MPDMVSVSASRAKSMLEGGRVARDHEVFGQQGRPRLWHDRLETQFFRQLVRVFPSRFSQFAPIAVPTGSQGKREFSDPRSFLPFIASAQQIWPISKPPTARANC